MLVANYTNPTSTLILAADKLSSELMGLDEDELGAMLKDRRISHKFQESEPQPGGKQNVATTRFQLYYHGQQDDEVKLSFFDQLVLSACMTEFLQKNTIVTPNIIYRDLGGAKNSCCFDYSDQIYQSIYKLSNLEMRLDAKDASRFLFQVKGTAFDVVRQGRVLPAEEVEVKLNGQRCRAFQIKDMSLVFEYAQCKGHLANIPISHLTVPHTKNTLTFMLLKVYVYSRILRIQRQLSQVKKKHQEKDHSIRLDTLYQTCGFTKQLKSLETKALSKFYASLMKQITRFMDHLIQNKVISSYQLVDDCKTPQKSLRNCTKVLFT